MHGQVHGQEREVVGDVDEAQPRVELQAVERDEASTPAHDIAAMQVAVAFAHAAGAASLEHARAQSPVGTLEGRLQCVEVAVQDRRGQPLAEFAHVVARDPVHGVGRAERRVDLRLRRPCVHLRELCGEIGDLRRGDGLSPQQLRQLLVAIELPHAQRMLEGFAVRPQAWGVGSAPDRHDLEVELRRVSKVQSQLLPTQPFTSLGAGIIQERQAYGLLDLVGVAPGQEDPGNVRFDAADGFVDVVQRGVRRWSVHCSNECRPGGLTRNGSGGICDVHARFGPRRLLQEVYPWFAGTGSLRSILMVPGTSRSTIEPSIIGTTQQRNARS